MSTAFTLFWIAGIIAGACAALHILYSAYKITEARTSERLIDAEFPISTKRLTKKTMRGHKDLYAGPNSSTRIALGSFYADSEIESLRRQGLPQKLPKGRHNK